MEMDQVSKICDALFTALEAMGGDMRTELGLLAS